jgi:hypothetical protein
MRERTQQDALVTWLTLRAFCAAASVDAPALPLPEQLLRGDDEPLVERQATEPLSNVLP